MYSDKKLHLLKYAEMLTFQVAVQEFCLVEGKIRVLCGFWFNGETDMNFGEGLLWEILGESGWRDC